MPVSYKDFTDRIRRSIWPWPGEPKSLVTAHDDFFLEAMIDIARDIKCLQRNNTTVIKACNTYVQCAITVADLPVGKVKYVYAIAGTNWCDRVFYEQVEYNEILRWSNWFMADWTPPANAGLPALNKGYKYASSETDHAQGRARTGIYAIHNNRLYVAPWLQSNETLVIEWDGIKKSYSDDDIIDDELWDKSVASAIKSFVMHADERDYGTDNTRAGKLRDAYVEKRAEILVECERRTRVEQPPERPLIVRRPNTEELEDDSEELEGTIPETNAVLFAGIGDYGAPDLNPGMPEAVAAMVNGFSPSFIITNGDNIYSPTDNYQAAVADIGYADYITDDLTTNRFWPAIQNHDYNDPANGIQDYFDFFTLPHNERYYDIVKGPVHFFFLNGEANEPDGRYPDSVQADWCKARMKLSTSRWKIVVVGNAPYTNSVVDEPGHTMLRWDFKDWGADLIFSGDTHAYERFIVDGLMYVVCGASGAVLSSLKTPPLENDPYTVVQLEGVYGAVIFDVDCVRILGKFVDKDGTVRDTFQIDKPTT